MIRFCFDLDRRQNPSLRYCDHSSPVSRSHVKSDPGSFTARTYTSRNQVENSSFFSYFNLPETTLALRHRSIFDRRRVLIREVTKNFSDLYICSIVGGVCITDVMHCTSALRTSTPSYNTMRVSGRSAEPTANSGKLFIIFQLTPSCGLCFARV
jgi:hypothetical protein